MAPRGYDTWDEVYRHESIEGLPWFYAGLDPDFLDAMQTFEIGPGRALDLGCGPGTQAIALWHRGFSVVATDLSPSAIEAARTRATSEQRGAEGDLASSVEAIDFRVDDFLDTRLSGPFDLVLDRGVFHLFDPALRHAYARNLLQLLGPGGFLLLKCFSHLQPPGEGPHRIHPDELQATLGNCLVSRALRETEFQGQHPEGNPRALLAVYQRDVYQRDV